MLEINCLDLFVSCFDFLNNCLGFFKLLGSSFFLCFFSHGGVQARGPDPEKVVSARGWGPKPRKSGGPKGEGRPSVLAQRVGRPNISRFLSLSRRNFHSSSSFSGGLFVEFWWCLKRQGRSNVHIWSSLVVRVEPWRPQSRRRGFTRQPENSKRAKLRVLALQTPPKFHETPR